MPHGYIDFFLNPKYYVVMRISIIGMPGSGKTTLAERISKKLDIPHIHLDRFWFEAGGQRNSRTTPNIENVRAYIREKTLEAIGKESWVSDGFYSRIQPEIAARADTIIFLDIPLWRRLINHTTRIGYADRHKELTLRQEILFFFDIIRRHFTARPKIQALVREHRDKLIILTSYKKVDVYVRNL